MLLSMDKILTILLLGFLLLGIGSVTPAPEEKSDGLRVSLGNLGKRMVESGVIDREKFLALYVRNPKLKKEAEELLDGDNKKPLQITPENSGLLLNYLWALGLGNSNPILQMEMMDPRYGGAGNFASTGGWTLAKGNAMNHYSQHQFFTLTEREQALVDKISRGIYRPCCGNSAHFPDCNHGMAMLGFLELMASQGASEEDMWKAALAVNSYWFPDTFMTIATYMKNKGVEWQGVNPQEVLGINYSSASGYQKMLSQMKTQQLKGGVSCGI